MKIKCPCLHPLKWAIWSLAVFFYFYEYILRVFPSVMVEQLIDVFQINAAELGTLSAFYLYAYAPMQLPVGALMDRYGARKLLTLSPFICAIGALLFGFSYHLLTADIARFLMGMGSAFGFIGMVYISSHYFSGKILAMLIGLGNSIGTLGAVCGQGPLSLALNEFGWRPLLFFLGLIGLILSGAIYLIVKNEPKGKDKECKTCPNISTNIMLVCKNWQTWVIAIIAGSFYLTTTAFAALWAVPFLEDVHHLSVSTAGFAASMIFIGWIIGGPTIGYLSDRVQKRKIFLLIFSALAFITITPLIYIDNLPTFMIFSLLFLVGVFSSALLLNFSLAIELNNKKAKGMSVAITNFAIFLTGSIFQPLVGYLLDFHRQGFNVARVAIHTPENYRFALMCFPLSFLVAFAFSLLLKESKHISHTDPH